MDSSCTSFIHNSYSNYLYKINFSEVDTFVSITFGSDKYLNISIALKTISILMKIVLISFKYILIIS